MRTLDLLLVELRQREVALWVEDDRLRYRAEKDALTPELLTEVKNRKVEILKFLKQATESISSQLPPIVKLDRNEHLPLSFAQQRLWLLHQFEPESSSNNMPVVVKLTGVLNVALLKQSLEALVRRHEVLRTHFPSVDGQPTQVIVDDMAIDLPIVDLRQLPERERDAEALRLATQEARSSFNLSTGPILRLLLVQLSDREHLMVWNMHCIICDGASSDVFYRDLTAIYGAFLNGQPLPFPALSVQYVDFAHWQRQWLQGEVLATQLNYWKQKLEGDLPVIKLPTDRPRPPIIQTYRGDRCARMLPKFLNAAVLSLSQKLGATQFMTLIATFEILLHRYSQQKDILISFASAGRGQVETEGLIGFFSNTLIQRINFEGDPTFRELLDRVRAASLEAYTHQDLPFEKLVEELSAEQSQSRSPLFQVKFALNPPWSNGRGMASVQLPDLTFTSLFGYIYHGKTKYDLILVMREQDEGLGMVFDYNADLFDSSTIARMLGHFETLLEGIVANPDCKISELPLLTPEERQQILHEWNPPTSIQASTDRSQEVQEQFEAEFEAQVELTHHASILSTTHSTPFSAELLGQTIQQHQLTTLSLPIRLFHRLVDWEFGNRSGNLVSLQKLYVGGDANGDWLSPAHVERFREFLPKCRLFNVYQVAENADFTCCHEVGQTLPEHTTIPIGRPIANTQAYVLDRDRQLVPIGIVGELYIRDDRLTSYFNQLELTPPAFIANPFSQQKDTLLYKTGDLARYLPDGTLEFVGAEALVSLHGLHIELGRVEAILNRHPAVRESCVLIRPASDRSSQKSAKDPMDGCAANDSKELAAFVVLQPDRTITSTELRTFLKTRLSSYIIPSTFASIAALPLTAHGYIDRYALVTTDMIANLSEKTTDPRDPLEQQLVGIWKKLLGDRAIGIHDNFFELGGNSLLSVRMVAEIEKTFSYYFPLSSFFQIGTIAEIAQWIREKPSETTIAADNLPEGLCLEDYRALLSFNAGRIGKHLGKLGLVVEIPPAEPSTAGPSTQPFVWIGDLEFSKRLKLPHNTIYSIAATSWTDLQSPETYTAAIAPLLVDELLTAQPTGPYVIGAYCYESLVALEMAQLLQKQGKEVALLAIIDRSGPSRLHRFLMDYDIYFKVPIYHLLKLAPLSLKEKWQYIRHRLPFGVKNISDNARQSEEVAREEYNPVTPKAYDLHIQATRSYVPKVYSGKVALIKSTKSPLTGTTRDLLITDWFWLFPCDGWEGIFTGKVEVHKIPCRHLELPLNPYAEKLGRILSKCLEQI
ncbi:condensation domain-containing protein [Tumidithrix elongata RA019]|uniref:Condensation domain-containing protein n=1 Tax=Tumidithrix elongata BACA0141 TaxID=2716417 RepID=A0AAW9PZC3_9CYAN|nr:condensation domain-containing protein [Tumidithrix elongata RA019]